MIATCAGSAPSRVTVRVAVSGAGIGIDLVDIARIERVLERRPALADRLFHPGELAYAADRRRPARHLAARFAAKEAVVKALGRPIPLRDIEVVGPSGGGAPGVRLHGAAQAIVGELDVEVRISLTHTDGQAGAVAVCAPRAACVPPRPAGSRLRH